MLKLAKCCQTCGYAHFVFKHNSGSCKYWTEQLGTRAVVFKTMACDMWFPASEVEKKWDWERPERRNAYWKREINRLNKLIWEKGKGNEDSTKL